jgi:SAM-dependent methyltransferase
MQAADWQGAIGEGWARSWRATDRTFAPVDRALVDLVAARLAIVPAPRVLDVGCGAGATALSIAAALAEASVTGVDLSPALIATATARGAAEPRCRFEIGDAGSWRGAGAFDLIVSRHGVMFFDNPRAAFTHLRTLAAPGAPLVFSCFRGRALNPWASEPVSFLPRPPAPVPPETPGPFAFADRERVNTLLVSAGWSAIEASPLDYDYVAGEGDDPVDDAVAFFLTIGPVATLARALAPDEQATFRATLARFLDGYRSGDRVVLPAAAWLWTARA